MRDPMPPTRPCWCPAATPTSARLRLDARTRINVLIRVRASSLNRADVGVAAGHQHGRVGGIGSRIGLECSGEIAAVGGAGKYFKAGDRVMGSAPGTYAE